MRIECIPNVKSSLLRNGFPSQRILAEHLDIAQSTVSNFLNGKPVDYLNVNKSPFNVGLPIELPEFTSDQVQELARRHGLNWNVGQVEQLMALVGGHPYLVRLAMYAIARQDITLEQLVQEAPKESGIYKDHLRRHLGNLENHPTLLAAFREVVSTENSVQLPSKQAFKLNSMGLVKLSSLGVTPRCYLYKQYFRERLALRGGRV